MSQLEQKQADEILDLIDEKIELRRMLERVLAVTRAYLAENEHTGTVADDAGNVLMSITAPAQVPEFLKKKRK